MLGVLWWDKFRVCRIGGRNGNKGRVEYDNKRM